MVSEFSRTKTSRRMSDNGPVYSAWRDQEDLVNPTPRVPGPTAANRATAKFVKVKVNSYVQHLHTPCAIYDVVGCAAALPLVFQAIVR